MKKEQVNFADWYKLKIYFYKKEANIAVASRDFLRINVMKEEN